jgi:hypothetical protein
MPTHDSGNEHDDLIERLKAQAAAAAAGRMVANESAGLTPDVQEQFWRNVVAFETAGSTDLTKELNAIGVELPEPDDLDDVALHKALWRIIEGLARRRVFLDQTDHLIPEITSVDVPSMREPLSAVTGTDDVACALRDAPQGEGGARRVLANVALDERPRGFDGIEVRRVGRQIVHCGAAGTDQASDLGVAVRLQIIEEHDIAASQAWRQTAADPVDEGGGVDGPPLGVQRHPARPADGANQRQVVAPVHRPRLNVLLPPLYPRVGPPHREVRARFIEHDKTRRVNAPPPCQERGALGLDVGAIDFARPRAFFLSTYPARRTARTMLDRLTRAPRATWRLYARRSSSHVASAWDPMTASSTAISTGDCHPPRFGRGVTSPVVRTCMTQRSRLLTLTAKSSAMASYEPSPASYAPTARSRSATGYGLGMPTADHDLFFNSSGLRD